MRAVNLYSSLRELRALSRALAAIVVTGLLSLPQIVIRVLTRGPASLVVPRLWHQALCRILALKVERVGTIDTRAGVIFVGNHISHFDIFALGASVRAAFIAKDDMRAWPGMRWLGAMQHTLFVSRRARDARRVVVQMTEARRQGRPLVLFAEGTTSGGACVAPFRSSLFAVLFDDTRGSDTNDVATKADPRTLANAGRGRGRVQPFTLTVLAADGHAVHNQQDRDLYAFHGGMQAGAHVWRFLRSRGAQVRIRFHAPIDIAPGITRKQLAAHTHAIVASGLETSA